MSSKRFKALAILSIPALLLTGCASSPESYGMNQVQVSEYPSWAESSVSGLAKEGWEVNDSMNLPVAETENIKFPDIYTLTSPDKNCEVSFNSEMYSPWNDNSDDSFNTQRYVLAELERKLSPDLKTATLSESKIKVKGDNKQLDALTASYSYANRVYDENAPADSVIPFTKESGTYNAMITARTLPTNLPNLAAQLSFNKGIDLPKESRPVVSIQYKCLDEKLDEKVIQMISEDATLELIVKK